MAFIIWNVKGINTDLKMDQIISFLKPNKPSIIALLENKLSNEKITKFLSEVDKNWDNIHNNDYVLKGGILLLWNKSTWSAHFIQANIRHITCIITNLDGYSMYLTIVCASNLFYDKELLWQELSQSANVIDIAWLLVRDFKIVLSPKDKKGGLQVPFSHLIGFRNFLLTCGHAEVNIKGFQFTWRRKGIATHIDKVLINSTLLQHFLTSIATATSSPLNDYIPIIIKLHIQVDQKRGIPFRYNNSWHLAWQ